MQTEKYLVFEQAILREKIRSPEHCLKLENWQGPPNINKVEQSRTV